MGSHTAIGRYEVLFSPEDHGEPCAELLLYGEAGGVSFTICLNPEEIAKLKEFLDTL